MNIQEMSTNVLREIRRAKESKAQSLRLEADRLHSEADDIEDDARVVEREISEIDDEIERRVADEQRRSYAAAWGEPIAAAIVAGRLRVHVSMLGSDWLTNGSFGWTFDDAAIEGWERRDMDTEYARKAEADIAGDLASIDIHHAVQTGDDSGIKYHDFDVGGRGIVRYQDAYITAIRELGDTFGVSADNQLLIALRDGRPVAFAMPMRRVEHVECSAEVQP